MEPARLDGESEQPTAIAERQESRVAIDSDMQCGRVVDGVRELLDAPAQIVGSESVALPDNEHSVAGAAKTADGATIAGDVRVKLRLPKASISSGGCRSSASAMAMPEAAVNEDGPATGAICEIWASR